MKMANSFTTSTRHWKNFLFIRSCNHNCTMFFFFMRKWFDSYAVTLQVTGNRNWSNMGW